MADQVKEQETNPLGNSETFGRDERSEKRAKRSFRQLKTNGKAKVRASIFEPPKNSNEISVNRMDLASETKLAEIGMRNANLIGKNFWGWYIFTTEDIIGVGCSVGSTPSKDNPFHADIFIPVELETEGYRHAIKQYAISLAYCADFLPWGEWTNEIERDL